MRKSRPMQEASPQELFAALRDTRCALDAARARFDNTVEPELIEACIHELGAIEARYSYLLRRMKESGARAVSAPLTEGRRQWV